MKAPDGYVRYERDEEHTTNIDTFCFGKRVPSKYKCNLNERDVVIYINYLIYKNEDVNHKSMRMGIRAETASGLWIDTTFYSMAPDDYSEALEEKLIKSWEILNKDTKCKS